MLFFQLDLLPQSKKIAKTTIFDSKTYEDREDERIHFDDFFQQLLTVIFEIEIPNEFVLS